MYYKCYPLTSIILNEWPTTTFFCAIFVVVIVISVDVIVVVVVVIVTILIVVIVAIIIIIIDITPNLPGMHLSKVGCYVI